MMTKQTCSLALLTLAIGMQLHLGHGPRAASTGQLGASAMVAERCRIDFSEGSADYFETCNSVQVAATERAHNVLGEIVAVAASADPYYLDRDPESANMARPVTSSASMNSTGADRSKAPRVVTIHY
ncbi:hypothetical protein [Herbaspirillum sp. NPDC101396]|uniref:hypothetical protein n=1 Tax=Herbaspirillum sp. NPDC101396 TaxID=3364005 RepID=UPI00383B2497